mmetsp:Transcript_147958/g.475053  ORF Transcript_147958/g.475053 Transcript_147958/m.475053 type:complete len:375 (-) Transcript_147958:834-1958(-)
MHPATVVGSSGTANSSAHGARISTISHSEACGSCDVVRQMRVLVAEQLSNSVHATHTLLQVVLAVPEVGADAFVSLRAVLHAMLARTLSLTSSHTVQAELIGGLPPLVIAVDAPRRVQDTRQLIQRDLSRRLVVVGAIRAAVNHCALRAAATGHPLDAARILVLDEGLGAGPRQRVPDAPVEAVGDVGPRRGGRGHSGGPRRLRHVLLRMTLVMLLALTTTHRGAGCNLHLLVLLTLVALVLLQLPHDHLPGVRGRRHVVADVVRNVPIQVLAADDKAMLLPDLVAPRCRAFRRIKRDERSELLRELRIELLRVLHRQLVAHDTSDTELSGHRGHDLVVQVPHDPWKIGDIHILQRVLGVALRTVDVEGHLGHA